MKKRVLLLLLTFLFVCTGCSDIFSSKNNESITYIDIRNAKLSTIAEQKYTGKEIKPTLTVTLNEKTLLENIDYTLAYENNINVGVAKVIITGIGSYNGTVETNFKIIKSTSSKPKAIITCSNKTYNGKEQTIASCSGGTIANANKKDVGSYTVTCKGDQKHSNAKSTLCSINAEDFSKVTVSTISDQTYTGKQITPIPTVKLNSTILKKDIDYTISYSNNINAGTAKITLTGKTNYKGTKVVTFKIISIAVTGIKLNKTEASLRINTTLKLTATITPTNASDKTITWTSNNKTVATVDTTGKITAKKPGTATITAKTSNGKTVTCKITVKPIKLLFVGNSKTYYNMYREFVINMATSKGYKFVGKQPKYQLNNYNKGGDYYYKNILNTEDNIENSYYSFTEGSRSLEYHYNTIINNNKYKDAFSKLEVDYVILQELSPSHLKYEEHKKGITHIISLLTAKNPNLKVYIRNAWLHKSTSDSDFYKAMKVTEDVVAELNKNLNAIKLSNKIGIINDGYPIWDAKHGNIQVFIDENGHPNYLANYASALAAVKAIFNINIDDIDYLPTILDSNNYKSSPGSPYWYGNYKTECLNKTKCDILIEEQKNISKIKNLVNKY